MKHIRTQITRINDGQIKVVKEYSDEKGQFRATYIENVPLRKFEEKCEKEAWDMFRSANDKIKGEGINV